MTKLSDILIILHPSEFFLFQLLRKDTFIFSLGYQWSFSIIKIYFHINAFLLINNFHRQITIFLFYQSITYVVTFVMHHCQLLKQSICLFRMSSVDTHGCKFFFFVVASFISSLLAKCYYQGSFFNCLEWSSSFCSS